MGDLAHDLAPRLVPEGKQLGDFHSVFHTRGAVSPSEAHWLLLQTKPCQEFKAARFMGEWAEETLLPVLPVDEHDRKRNRRVTGHPQPLFAGYIFSRFSALYIGKANVTYGVLRVVHFGEQPALVEDALIEAIRAQLDEHQALRPRCLANTGLKPGDRVRVISGPLKGQEGMLEERLSGHDRATILLGVVEQHNLGGWSSPRKPVQPAHGATVRLQVGIEDLQKVG